MAGVQQGLQVAFYFYPCALFTTLLLSQSIQYYRDRHGKLRQDGAIDEKKAESIRWLYARLVWFFQLILSLLLVCTSFSPDESTEHHC
jgi:hypothetical protein